MTSEDFVRLIIDHFGKSYRSRGISDVIKVDLRGVPSENLTRLLKEVKRHYKASYGLPELPDILKIAKETEIDLRPNRNEKIIIIWQCGECGKRYNYEYGTCPGCGKSTNALPDVCYCGDYAHQTIGAKFETPQQSKCPKCLRPRETGRVVKGG